jgi:hypothetical protein
VRFTGLVERFPGPGGWYFVRVDPDLTDGLPAERGLIAVTVTIDGYTWDTSLMPLKGGTKFVPLPARVRQKRDLDVGDPVTGTFALR